MIYGVTGTLDLSEVATAVAEQSGQNMVLVFGLVFIVVGIGFKLGAVPFHMWIPDVYEGAPTAVTLFISSAPKVAAFAMLVRLLVDSLQPLVVDWQGMLMILATLSIAIGNIVAIAQTNIKRMLAYSAIAHMGYMLIGVIAGTSYGYSSAMFYAIIYALMSMGGFGMVILLSRKGFESDRLDDFRGLAKRSPWFALIMLILMFSMAGVPPFAGFWAKWFVIAEVVASGHIWVAVMAVFFSIIGAYYYLKVVKLMYFDEPVETLEISASGEMKLILSFNGLSLIVLGILPGSLMSLCLAALG
jgi:NADH-quinone oxidoreductase subunit N